MAATEGENGSSTDDVSPKAPEGIVLPPRNIRDIVEKSADYVARNGERFQERLQQTATSTSKTSFVFPDDPYHAYYRWRVEEYKSGRVARKTGDRKQTEVSFQGREERKGPEEPEKFSFSARMPNISAQDLDVVKLTALFVAKNGRNWMTTLSQREAGNFQFDFLRSQHSLYQFFSRLVDQYSDLLNGDSVDDGQPQKKRIVALEANLQDRAGILEKTKKLAAWTEYQEAQKVAKEEQEQKERIAYAQIDWHDFIVVETVVFDDDDDTANLPAPPSLNDLQSASLEQKAALSLDPSRRIEEAMPDDFDQYYEQAQALPQTQPAPAVRTPGVHPLPQKPQTAQVQQQAQVQRDNEEASRMAALQEERQRAQSHQEAAKANAPVRILKDYVPAAQARRRPQNNTSICPNCKQAIPNDEMSRHLQIEMLDPQWREQALKYQQRSSTTNLSTTEVANNLKRLASQRTDVFDPVTGQAISEAEQERRKRAELQAYDGVSTMPNPHALANLATGTQGAPGTGTAPQTGEKESVDVQEQLRQLHAKYKT